MISIKILYRYIYIDIYQLVALKLSLVVSNLAVVYLDATFSGFTLHVSVLLLEFVGSQRVFSHFSFQLYCLPCVHSLVLLEPVLD